MVAPAGSLATERVTPMRPLFLTLRRLLVAEDGPTAVEYAVMLTLIVAVCLAAISAIGTQASSAFTTVGNSIHG
jgi:pilus assembly protein Flp/PilA